MIQQVAGSVMKVASYACSVGDVLWKRLLHTILFFSHIIQRPKYYAIQANNGTAEKSKL